MQTQTIEQVIKDCIKTTHPFSTFDIIDECYERGVGDVYFITAVLDKFKFPLYIKKHKIVNEKTYTIYHSSDYDPSEYNYYITQPLVINKANRLVLPNIVSDIVGFDSGTKLVMEVCKNSITLSESKHIKNTEHTLTITVDSYRNIRINKRFLGFLNKEAHIYLHPINKKIIISGE